MLMPNGENRKFFLRSRKPKHTSPFSVLSFSAGLFQTLGIFLQFHRTFSKFRRTFSKFQGKESEKCPTKLHKQHVTFSKRHVISSKISTSFEKTTHNPAKTSENYDFQSRWESHNSQQLFLCSKYRVKWRGRKHKLLLKNNQALAQNRLGKNTFSSAYLSFRFIHLKQKTGSSVCISHWTASFIFSSSMLYLQFEVSKNIAVR